MPKIRILPDQLANRIAAGEVVERPSSVVKELIENSIDAGAERIDIEIEGGGTRLIRIKDNGAGMDEDDVLLCFERHGTSKISADDDLNAIATLGFRGEAIPSIASVSRMRIVSRPQGSDLGTEVQFDYGTLTKMHESGCSQGTLIEVGNLFGRTPARRKFLKTKRTELSHIDDTVKNYGLACPAIAFTLSVDGKQTLSFNQTQSIEERLAAILGYKDAFIPVGEEKAPGKRSLQGFLVPPDKQLSGSARVRLFINGRAIRDRLMHHAVLEGLHGFLLKGHTPAGYLHLQISPDEVDVNVHPAKHEVRFRDTRSIHQFIKQTIEEAMRGYQQTIRADFFTRHDPVPSDEESFMPSETDISPPLRLVPESREMEENYLAPSQNEKPGPITQQNAPLKATHPAPTPLPSGRMNHQISPPKGASTADSNPFTMPAPAEQPNRHTLHIIGQFKNLYIFCQSEENLFVIDQHAAHERLLYEKFRRHYLEGKVASQNLLFPETVDLSPSQIELVENNLDILNTMGFSIKEFGGNSYVISAVPALVSQRGASEMFFDVLAGFGEQKSGRAPGGKIDDILASLACKAAIKSGHSLNDSEINGLLDQMVTADLFSHCPHGRPVVKKFTPEDIKKWFSRT